VDALVIEAARAQLEERPYKAQKLLFLLEKDGTGGFIMQDREPFAQKRLRVYTRRDHETRVAIEWAPGLS
jgi:hypothetical protein